MREIILDTETTGLEPTQGHRLVEIGCVEMVHKIRTGKTFHTYLNPERDVPAEAQRVHGLSTSFLLDKPLFEEVAGALIAFIGDARLVIHNAIFDMKFVNHELTKINFPTLSMERVTDTLAIARKKYPGAQNNLDALCRRFNIDLSARTKHGALLDAELLADIYIELCGGKQVMLDLVRQTEPVASAAAIERVAVDVLERLPTDAELEAHAALVAMLKKPLWTAA